MVAAGSQLGPYEVVALLGSGGMGDVYRARDPRLGRDVALKVLPKLFANDPDRLRRFRSEAKAIAALSHPNIMAVHDVGEQDGVVYLVSELLEGETLRRAVARGALPPRRAIEVATQVARGLAAAHAKGLAHRDIKPENIFLTTDGHVKILDFGLAKVVSPVSDEVATVTSLTDPGTVVGTVGYMSPEQVRGLAIDGRSDLFSLGVVLFEMLAGRRPFDRATSADTMSAILNEDPPALAEAAATLAPALDRIVGHCLEKAPERRYQTGGDLAFSLDSLSTASGSAAAAPPAPARAAAWVVAAVSAALALIAGVAVGHWAWVPGALPAPTFHRLTFRAGTVFSAMFAPDEQTVVYSAAWQDEPTDVFSTRLDSHEARSLGLTDGYLAAMSRSSELALVTHPSGGLLVGGLPGTLARVPLAGGASRPILDGVLLADWLPDGSDLAVVRLLADNVKRLELPIGHAVFSTHDNVLAMRVSPAGDRVALAVHAAGFGTDGSIVTIDRSGHETVLAPGELGDFADVAWTPSGDEVWYDFGIAGGEALKSVDLSGHERTLMKLPGRLQVFDISKSGRVLLNKTNWRVDLHGAPSASSAERDYSWLDASEVDDVTADGTTLLVTEFGEGGDPRHWSVYLRKTDGTPATRIGDGQAMAISPDGTRVLAMVRARTPQLMVYPVGAGQPTAIPTHGISDYYMAVWLPDGQHVLLSGVESGHGQRCYLESLDGTEFRAVSPEGYQLPQSQPAAALAPDGRTFVAIGADDTARLFALDGSGGPRAIAGIRPLETPLHWSADGRSVYVARFDSAKISVDRLDQPSGTRTVWKQLAPGASAGARQLYAVQISPERGWYFYSCWRVLSDLYAVDGVR